MIISYVNDTVAVIAISLLLYYCTVCSCINCNFVCDLRSHGAVTCLLPALAGRLSAEH